MASWSCNMPKFQFTAKLPERKLELIIWNSLPVNLLVCPICGAHSVTVWICFPEVPVSYSPSIGTAQKDSQASVWLPRHSGIWVLASDTSYLLLLFGRNSALDFQPQTLSSVQRCLCSTALLGPLALLLATASAEGSDHTFLIGLVSLTILLTFLAYCCGRLCSVA